VMRHLVILETRVPTSVGFFLARLAFARSMISHTDI
jgi:hypothetical protein